MLIISCQLFLNPNLPAIVSSNGKTRFKPETYTLCVNHVRFIDCKVNRYESGLGLSLHTE